jgi:hypothetical protein
MDEEILVNLDIMQVTQIVNLPKVEAKSIFDIGCDDLGPSMAIIFFYLCLTFVTRIDY